MVMGIKYFRPCFRLMGYFVFIEYEQSLIALRLGYTMQRGLLICVRTLSAYGLYEQASKLEQDPDGLARCLPKTMRPGSWISVKLSSLVFK